MKILVTGATGFIGGNLIKYLLTKGHRIICLVRKTSGVDFLESRGIPRQTADIEYMEEVDKVFRESSPQAVFHCAAEVMSRDEAKLYRVNVRGTRNICRACRNHNIARLVYVSSVAVISGNSQMPLGDDLPYRATSAYGRSKIEAERIVLGFREKGLHAAVIRPCFVYGEDEPHLLDRILGLVRLRCIPIPDVPGANSRLNLVYVGNVVQALALALEKDSATEGTFIIADREIISPREFLEILYDEMGAGYPPVIPARLARLFMMFPPVGRRTGEFLKERVYDITRARTILGYMPRVSTEEGLRRTVRYWKQKQGAGCRKS